MWGGDWWVLGFGLRRGGGVGCLRRGGGARYSVGNGNFLGWGGWVEYRRWGAGYGVWRSWSRDGRVGFEVDALFGRLEMGGEGIIDGFGMKGKEIPLQVVGRDE